MNLETFFEKFELFADAPNAVQRMRELILELAVQGKLVEQQGEVWKQVELGEIVDLISGQHLLAHEHNSEGKGIPYLTGPSDFGEKTPIPTRWTESPKVVAKPGDILITVKGAGVGKTNILTSGPTAISRQLMAVRVTGANSEFVHLVLKGAASHFQSTMVGIAVPGIGRKDVLSLQLILPPLAEQKRIVAKVDELMALCDALEAQQKEREAKRTALAKAALAAFAEAPSPLSLERLFHPSFAINPADLRKSILTLAVQGKLVERGTIQEDDARQYRGKQTDAKTRRGVPEYVKPPDFLSQLDLPQHWLICSSAELLRKGVLVDLKDGNHGANHPKVTEFSERGVPFVTAAQVSSRGDIDFSGAYKLSGIPLSRIRVGFAKAGDLIYTHKGSVGRVAIASLDCVLSPQTTYYRLNKDYIDSRYLMYYMLSDVFTRQVDVVKRQTTRDFVSISSQYVFFHLIPPLDEQKRIVAKVDELMALVDRLETQVKTAKDTGARLLEAMVAELSGKAAA